MNRMAVALLVVACLFACLCSTADAGGCGRAQVIAAPVQVQAYYAPAIQLQAVQAQAYAAPVQLQAAQYYAAPVQLQVQAQARHHHAQAAIVAPVVKLKPVRFPNLPRNQ